jgi:hypothetical protein
VKTDEAPTNRNSLRDCQERKHPYLRVPGAILRLVHENKTTIAKYRATWLGVAESGKNIRVTRRRQQSATANTARETGNADTRIPGQRICHAERAVRVSYNPGQLVYRKQLVRGHKSKPRWLGPYQVIRRVSDHVYRIRVRPRDRNLNIEQLKVCRATREKLRSQRRERRQQHRSESCDRESNMSSSGNAESAFCRDPVTHTSSQKPSIIMT